MPAIVTAARAGPMVLVADDDFLVQRYAMSLLGQLGCGGVVVANGQLALDCLGERSFDLVLLDVSMPVLDGLATLARLRQAEAKRGGQRQRVAMVTAHAEPGDLVRLQAAGADGYIAKPFTPALFADEVRRCLALPSRFH